MHVYNMSFFSRRKDKKETKKNADSSIKRSPSQRSSQGKVQLVNGDIGSGGTVRPTQLCLQDEPYDPGDLGNSKVLDSPMRTSSRLSKTLSEVLRDKNALSCFIEFMESRKSGHYIRFWLDAESFQASTWSRLRSHSINAAKNSLQSDKNSTPKPVKVRQLEEEDKIETGSISSSHTLTEENTSLINQDVESDNTINKSENTENSSSDKPVFDTGQNSDPNSSLNSTKAESVIKTKTPSLPSFPCEHSPTFLPSSGEEIPPGGISQSCDSKDVVKTSPGVASVGTLKRTESLKKTNLSQEELADKLKKSIARDAVSIFQKYLSHDASHSIPITDDLRNQCVAKICREDGEVDPGCFSDAQDFVFNVMEKEHYPDFGSSEFHYKHLVHMLTSGKVYLADILYNDGAMFYFMEYMEQEGGTGLLQFWMAADNFQQHLMSFNGSYDGDQAQADAMVLYDKYFSLQASHPLGFDDKIRFDVESNICREGGPLPDCFARPRDIVLRTIEKSYFPNYLQSEIYYKYLSELVNTVTIATDLPKQTKHKRQDSDTSSVHSGHSAGSESIKNTLLAMDSSHLRKTLGRLNESDMNIDPGLLNPDLLWKRSNVGMTLGKVDSLGRFVSEFAPQPEQEKTKGASGFFKKKKQKDKEQEEMALHIAQMIINDVTSVTSAIGAMKDSRASSVDS